MMPRPDLGGRIEEQGLVSPPARTSSSRLILELPPPIQEIGLPSAGGLTNSWSLKKIAHSGEPSLAIAVPSASEGGGGGKWASPNNIGGCGSVPALGASRARCCEQSDIAENGRDMGQARRAFKGRR